VGVYQRLLNSFFSFLFFFFLIELFFFLSSFHLVVPLLGIVRWSSESFRGPPGITFNFYARKT